mmetsp:Transcript_9208/g.14603  ORF Transcript_9208/g.14603 Transcript_9208/m.14603 type:complete len:109 (-) Transcript_9208:180-506(-)
MEWPTTAMSQSPAMDEQHRDAAVAGDRTANTILCVSSKKYTWLSAACLVNCICMPPTTPVLCRNLRRWTPADIKQPCTALGAPFMRILHSTYTNRVLTRANGQEGWTK